MADTFYTLEKPSEAVVREKMSRFLAFAHPVETVEQAKEIIARYQKEYYDARHVCWAYMIGPDRREFQSNDNGEPSGTAGKPILGQINSFNLTNIVICVVRYFGGIKLGISGLIVAYRTAAREAIQAGAIIECHDMASLTFTFSYMAMNDIMKVVKQQGVSILQQKFDNLCSMTISFRADLTEELRGRIAAIPTVSFPNSFF